MSFIVCNKTPLKVAVQSLPSMNVDKTKFNSFIKQWQHQETVTNRLRAEGRGTRRAKNITQPPHNTKNTHYELGGSHFLSHSSCSFWTLRISKAKQGITQNKSIKIVNYVSRKVMLDPVLSTDVRSSKTKTTELNKTKMNTELTYSFKLRENIFP